MNGRREHDAAGLDELGLRQMTGVKSSLTAELRYCLGCGFRLDPVIIAQGELYHGCCTPGVDCRTAAERAEASGVLARLAANSHSEPGPLPTPCRIWDGAVNRPDGYGRISVNGTATLVHRAAWIERHGEPPAATPHVCHRCDVPLCWADDHLWVCTQAENLADMDAKGRRRSAAARRP
jgi:hypothetical protein